MSEIKKCYICSSVEHDVELTECVHCGKTICSDTEQCCEQLDNGDSPTCTKCIATYEKFDCNKCLNKEKGECPIVDYNYVYNCPEYIELTDRLKFELRIKEIIASEMGYEIYEIEDTSKLKDDLTINSLDAVLIIMEIEESYPSIKINDSDLIETENKTVMDLINMLYKQVEEVKKDE